MKISFESLKAKGQELKDTKLFALIAGIRGSGKSTILGTLKESTLLIASTLEAHAIESASLFGQGQIIPTLYDVDENSVQMKPDEALANLHKILDFLISSDELTNNISAVAIDSVSAIDKTLLGTTRVIQENNGFEVMKLLENEHLRIIKKLKELHRKGLHVLATMPILASFDEDGFYVTAKAELRGITTTSNIAGSFSDILVVGRFGSEYAFQMDLLFKKVGKEVSGAEKQLVFHPRIAGLSHQDLMEVGGPQLLLPADLSYIYQLKKSKREGN